MSFLWLIMPNKCIVCGKTQGKDEYICPECRPLIERLENTSVSSERAGASYDRCFVPFIYSKGIQRAIARMKFRDHPAAYRYFAGEIAAMLDVRPDFITFVPQNRKTRHRRGYNQTELIAREIGRLLKLPVKSTLVRSEQGHKQVELGHAKRLKNAKKLYQAKGGVLSGSCLIVDDVITTGATMKACCDILRRQGCSEVYAAAAARTLKKT